MAGTCSMLCLILITIFIPPLGVFLISGCSADFFINLLLTILGYLPGHIHAFYLEYVYYRNTDTATAPRRAPGVYSERIQQGAHHQTTYGTI
ncbi:YqaE/Pmp3 family membrane protein [Aspergillus homomorphus CBS 101889]|uniref:Putative stress response RCI peptide n=1 Tax=Aspergillus homomorphus (strain CBS 101889) TaxID=1450537 RepID=A0A395HMM3_ASPHC|nr:putative stress response RCI peptide [Aspergillus homomorphus CBS 101889]RAL09181.1 putative stress response RCI peptide [Aspergillus homomorphus CBS 101889]